MKKTLFLLIFIFSTLNAKDSSFDLKAFGTLGGVYNTNSDYKFRKDAAQKEGSSNNLYLTTDTLLGLQPIVKINNNFSIISQAIIQKDFKNENKAKVDWGYLKYDSANNFIFKVGRIKTPYYKNSNNQNIGYSRLMIREPIEVYGQIAFSGYNGVELIYSNIINKYFYNIQINYGKEEFDSALHSINQTVTTKVDKIRSLNLTFGTDVLETRVTYMRGKSEIISDYLSNVFNYVRNVENKEELANEYELKDKASIFLNFGLFLDYNNIIFSTEYGQRESNSFYADLHGYYTTLGYRYKKIIPYISYAKIKMDQKISNTGSATLDSIMKVQNLAQSSKTIGFKYYINKNLDFKFEYQRITPKGVYGGFYIDPTNNYPNTKSNVFSFVIDFVF